MKLKHIIITNFLANPNMSIGDNIFNESIIENGINLMNTFMLPSLANQTCKDFELYIMTNGRSPIDISRFKLDNTFKVTLLPVWEMKNVIRQLSNEYDYIITTAMDYDDMIYSGAVEDTQKHVDINIPFKLYGYYNGCKYYYKTNSLYKYKPSYIDYTPVNIFASIMYNTNMNTDNLYIFSTGHNKYGYMTCNFYKTHNIDMPANAIEFNKDIDLAWLYVRHGNNDSKLIGRCGEEESESPNNKVTVTSDYLFNTFAYKNIK